MMRTSWGPWGAFAVVLAIAAGHAGCGDEAKKRLGATCDRDGECASGLCYEEVCLDPEADEDADGLINRLEATLGTDHRNADSDGDGVPDASELDVSNANKDYDGDGRADALESAIADVDDDCLPDQYDAEDTVQNGDLSPLVPIVCPSAGVCVADGATLAVVCDGPGDEARCDFAAVPGHEATEATCDERDNDCDGATDEGLDCTPVDPLTVGLVAWYHLDGDGQDSGPNAHHGTVVGALPTADRLGAAGKAMRFAAVGDRIEAALATHPVGDVDVTYVAWVRPEQARDRVAGALVVGEGDGARSALVVAGPRACGTYATGEDDAVYAERGCAPDRHWSHIAVVRTGGAARVYLNGRLVASDALPVGAPLVGTTLRMGLAAFVDGEATNSFRGALDDVRIWSRALSDAEIAQVYLGGEPERVVGTEARPGASCRHVLEGAPAATIADGSYRLDPDGDGPNTGFTAYCDMTRDGGGWTLAWAYELTAPGAFDSGPNAVTPRPGWGVPQADVPVSTTPPADPDTLGAVPYAAWPALGREVLFTSDLMDSVACEPGQGSFSDRTSGDVACRVVEDLVAACDDLVPWWLDWGIHGPSLSAQNLFLYFDGSTAEHFPTHDPCGGNGFTNTSAPVRGAVWLRPTDTTVRWPPSCNALAPSDRFDGPHVLDVDGDGPHRPGLVTCRFGLERGGWARVTENVARTIAEIGPRPREYFYVQGDRFYRSPVTDAVFLWDSFASVPGTWFWGSAEGAGTFACGDTPEGDMTFGVGCGAASGDAPRILPSGTPDTVAGATDLCEDPPGIFEPPSPDAVCAVDAELWVRPARCVPDRPGATGDGGLAAVAVAAGPDESPCWQAYGPAGFGDGFEASDDVPPGGQAPSLKVTNTELGNLIYAYQLTHVDLTFIAGRTYRVSFASRAEAARTLRLFVQTRDLSHHFGWADLPIATTWGRHELVFTAQQTSWNAMVNFQLAEVSTAPVWLDDVLVEDLGSDLCQLDAGSLLKDGGFASGVYCWERFGHPTNPTLASSDAVDVPFAGAAPSLRVAGTQATEVPADVGIIQRALPLPAGRRVRLSFWLKASAPTQVGYGLTTGFTGHVGGFEAVGTAWQRFQYDADIPADLPPEDSALQFQFGNPTGAAVWIDEVRLEDLGPACAPPAGELVADGELTQGTACWTATPAGVFTSDANEHAPAAGAPPAARELGSAPPALRAEPDTAGQLADVVLSQSDLVLEAGKTYRLALWHRAAAARDIGIALGDGAGLVLVDDLRVADTAWAYASFEIGPLDTTTSVRLELRLGGPGGHVWVDGVSLRETGLVSYYSLDADTGTTVPDEARAGNVATLVGGAWRTSDDGCPSQGCLELDGASYLQVASPRELPLGAAPRTIALFARATKNLMTSTESALVQWGTVATGQMFGLITSMNLPGVAYFYGHSADVSASTSLGDVWHHIAVTFDGFYIYIYVDGLLETAGSVGLSTVLDAHGLTIGWRPNDVFWQGLVDDVRIYDRALTPAEIQALANQFVNP